MKITDFRTTIVSVPFKEPERWAFGKRLGISNIILELETDQGLVGLGEAVGFPTVRVTQEILNAMRPVVIGRDPWDYEVLVHELTQVYGWHHFRHSGNCALGGVDMALWDLVGKASGQPLYKLLGGAFRKEIPYFWYVLTRELDVMAQDAQRGVAAGFETFYVKLGTGFAPDLEVVRTLREALGPGPKLRVDANEAWSDGSAAQLMRQLAQYDIEFFEQPLLYHDHDGAAQLRRSTGLPLAANQSAWTEQDVLEIIKKGAADFVLTDPHQLGSLTRFRHVAWMLETAGIPIIKHSFGDLGISTVAAMHVMASSPNFSRANQSYYAFLTDDVIEGGIPRFSKGCLRLTEGPGLGVNLDRQRVAKYADYFKQHGEFPAYASGKDLLKPA
ncbi:MAG: mandelate racemase [Acidobacteria bacterium]|nr:MAG: mandelate racemase [Acidobacteriota bacterium]